MIISRYGRFVLGFSTLFSSIRSIVFKAVAQKTGLSTWFEIPFDFLKLQIQICNKEINFQIFDEKQEVHAESKVGSLDNASHQAGGGNVEVKRKKKKFEQARKNAGKKFA